MADVLVTATLPAMSGDEADSVQNAFAFRGALLDAPTAAGFAITAVAGFYNTPNQGDPNPLAIMISDWIDRTANACTLRAYDITGHLDGSPHGSPIQITPFTLGAVSQPSGPMPEETSAVLTIRGSGWETTPVEVPGGPNPEDPPIRPKQRITGRLYVGPLHSMAFTRDGNKRTRLTAEVGNRMRDSANQMRDGAAGNGLVWSVWSRTVGILTPVTHVQSDDAPDTQRRRGAGPTGRVTLAVA